MTTEQKIEQPKLAGHLLRNFFEPLRIDPIYPEPLTTIHPHIYDSINSIWPPYFKPPGNN